MSKDAVKFVAVENLASQTEIQLAVCRTQERRCNDYMGKTNKETNNSAAKERVKATE